MNQKLLSVVRHATVSFSLLGVLGCQESSVDSADSESPSQPQTLAANTLSVNLSTSPTANGNEIVDVKADDTNAAIAVFEETDFSFGEMDPYTFGDHSFRVTNQGSAPLVLKLGESTCNCTVSEVPNEPIMPGQSAEIMLRWQTSKNNKYFSEESTVRTNDPNNSVVALRVRGHIRVHFGASPPRFDFARVRPGESESLTSLLSSQVWPSFEIEDVRSSLPGIKWEVSEPPVGVLKDIKATSGKHLTVTVPNYLKQGSFTHWLRVKIRPDGEGEGTEYELPLVGKVVRPVSVYGKNIDQTGTIRLGVISSHVGLNQKYMVKVRDRQAALLLRDTQTVPESLDVQLHTQDASAGLYILEIDVPKDSKPCDFISKPGGLIRLEFEHPRIDSLELKMVFAVADRPPTR